MADRLTFLGHSTVLIDLDGVRVLTDPLVGHLAGGVIRRHVPTVHPDALEGLAAVFISHGHLDHLPVWPGRRLRHGLAIGLGPLAPCPRRRASVAR